MKKKEEEIDVVEVKTMIYIKVLNTLGFMPLILLLHKYEVSEHYEECEIIKTVISEYNNCFDTNYPTSISQDVVTDYFKDTDKFCLKHKLDNLSMQMTMIEKMISDYK